MLACALLAFSQAGVARSEDGIAQLTGDDFDARVKGKDAFIKFYAPWCGHCKALAPTWMNLWERYQNSDAVLIAKVDCTVNVELCKRENVAGYPTLRYYTEEAERGKMYEGDRELEDLLKFTEDMFGSPCSFNKQDTCSERELDIMKEALAMTQTQRLRELEDLKDVRDAAVEEYNTKMKKLTKKADAVLAKRDRTIARIAPRHRIIKSVAEHANSQ